MTSIEGSILETRRHSRISCSLRAGCFWDDAFTSDQIKNISEGGAFLQTSKPLPPKEKVSLRIFLPKIKEPFDVTGDVVWSTRELPEDKTVVLQGIGIRFSFLEGDQRNRLRQFIGQHREITE